MQRYLAAAGVAARRKAEELITAGRVKVNGAVARVLGTKIDPDRDQVEVDGEAVVALDTFYVLLNKPKACITAVTDDRGRPTVMDYLPNLPVPVKPVGRLDFYSEGVLLLTNDGELAARLLAPASHVPKTYHVKVHGRLTQDDLKALRKGVQLDDGTTTMPAEVQFLPGETKHTWLAVTIHEGKHRQIHRMLESLGYRVDKLQRVAFANLTFHDLRIGDARELSQQELNELRDAVNLDHSAVARGTWRAHREDTDISRRARAKARAEAEENQLELDLARGVDPTDPASRIDDADDWSTEIDEDEHDSDRGAEPSYAGRRGGEAGPERSRARGGTSARGGEGARGARGAAGARGGRAEGRGYGARGGAEGRGPR
ncbi:MAG: pseudouridine synthase, partial [Kofleriaceae bacterium]